MAKNGVEKHPPHEITIQNGQVISYVFWKFYENTKHWWKVVVATREDDKFKMTISGPTDKFGSADIGSLNGIPASYGHVMELFLKKNLTRRNLPKEFKGSKVTVLPVIKKIPRETTTEKPPAINDAAVVE